VGRDRPACAKFLPSCATYAGTIGAEYMHITDTSEKRWVQSSLESVHGVPDYPPEVRRNLLGRLTAAEGLEHYLHTKYVGQKRFHWRAKA
jgi:2-oxoglutarate dehydrogenase E1 component